MIATCESNLNAQSGEFVTSFFVVYSETENQWYCDSLGDGYLDPNPSRPPYGDCSWGIGYFYNHVPPVCLTRDSAVCTSVISLDLGGRHYQLQDIYNGGHIPFSYGELDTTFDGTTKGCQAIKMCSDFVRDNNDGDTFLGIFIVYSIADSMWHCSATRAENNPGQVNVGFDRGDGPRYCDWGTGYFYTHPYDS